MVTKRIKELVKRAATLTYRKCTNDEANYRWHEVHNAKQILKRRTEKGLKDEETTT
jgi:hypothetical protein